MSSGSIFRHLVNFSLPLMFGNLFQILYNTVDTWVLGNYVEGEAYSAVGSVGSITTLLIGIFMGLSAGAGVVISQYYGAKQEEKVQEAVHTSIAMTLILGVLFTVIGIVITPFMLGLMNMPDSAIPDASTYLFIYFAGVTGLMLYNIGAGILRAVGDSQRPFYFLVFCALLNTALDLLFVLGFDWGVAGVAFATVLSQLISAVMVLWVLMRSNSCVHLSLRKLKLHWSVLKKILIVGVPSAIQMAITSFSNIFVQGYINDFGTGCMGGWTSYAKIDSVVMIPMNSISLASTTFVGQNLGCNQVDRAKKGVSVALLLSVISTIALSIPVMVFARPLAAFFNADPDILHHAVLMLLWMTPFYFVSCFTNIYSGALRGAGNSKAPMIIMLSSYVAFRQIYLFVMSRVWNEVVPIVLSYPAGWIVCAIALTIYYHRTNLERSRLVDD